MKILTFSTLYPNAEQPGHGIFVETRLKQLVASGRVDTRVVAPVPWFPFRNRRYGRYALYARAPRREVRHGLEVLHPRYPVLPKVGTAVGPLLLAIAIKPVLERMLREGFDFDLIDSHYFYPDGVAATMLGRSLRKPVAITARGTDLNLLSRLRLPRRMIRWSAGHATALITVSAALKQVLVELGVAPERIAVLRNGVDLQLFRPVDRDAVRARLGITRTALLSVGNLIPLKGHDLAIEALRMLPDVELLIAGDGPDRSKLQAFARQLGVSERVRFVGLLPQPELRDHYGAADALVLASSREGWANVLLESMACGTPVIATRAGGTPEVVAVPEAGVLMAARSASALADAAKELLGRSPDRAATRRYAEGFDWNETTHGQLRIFERMIDDERNRRAA